MTTLNLPPHLTYRTYAAIQSRQDAAHGWLPRPYTVAELACSLSKAVPRYHLAALLYYLPTIMVPLVEWGLDQSWGKTDSLREILYRDFRIHLTPFQWREIGAHADHHAREVRAILFPTRYERPHQAVSAPLEIASKPALTGGQARKEWVKLYEQYKRDESLHL